MTRKILRMTPQEASMKRGACLLDRGTTLVCQFNRKHRLILDHHHLPTKRAKQESKMNRTSLQVQTRTHLHHHKMMNKPVKMILERMISEKTILEKMILAKTTSAKTILEKMTLAKTTLAKTILEKMTLVKTILEKIPSKHLLIQKPEKTQHHQHHHHLHHQLQSLSQLFHQLFKL